jgi:HSP90 family molecular chaperone
MAKRNPSAAQEKPAAAPGEVFAFQTEMQQLLHIIIHSLYSERDIFLRELISNASDAINRLKFRSLTAPEVRDKDAELEITLELDAEAKALTLSDTGIGMSREEAIRNLGTIARSGTLEFVKQLSAAEPGQRTDLIGQFGVGFYSVFMVAKRVVVDSCPADPAEAPVRWVSEGQGEYRVLPGERKRRGTAIRIELKDDAQEFVQGYRVEGIVQRYSSFIPHPIRLDGRRLNVQEAIWSQPRGQVKAEQYSEFYKFLTHGGEEPLTRIHLSIDAPVQYQALLYVPPHLTNEVLYSPKGFGLQLYANKVLIDADCQALLPLYLRFLRGVVDTQDLPLNVSRETVQNNPLLARLSNSLAGRVLRELGTLAEKEPDGYAAFWAQYGKVLKEGLAGDPANRERLVELARFDSSACTDGALTTLKAYVGRMKTEQKELYFFSGPSREAIERNPHLEFFRKQGLEVLYLTDQVDDFAMTALHEYEGRPLVSIDQSELAALKDAPEAEAAGPALSGEALADLLALFRETLGEQVSDVKASRRLVDSPAVLVSADGIPGNLQKVMRMLNQDFKSMPKVLEINPAHPLVRDMATLRAHDAKHPALAGLVEQIYDTCLLVEGIVEQPGRMATRIQALMARAAALEAAQAAGPAEPAAEAPKAESPKAESPKAESPKAAGRKRPPEN